MRLEERQGERHCPLCKEGFSDGEVRACEECGTEIHSSCAEEFGGCPTIGCSASSGFAVERARSVAERVQDKLTDVVLQDIETRPPPPWNPVRGVVFFVGTVLVLGLGFLIHDALLGTAVGARATEVMIGLTVLAGMLLLVGWVVRDQRVV